MNWRLFMIPAVAGALILGCSDSPTNSNPGNEVLNPLAGGGRLRGHDPASGSGYTDSLPSYPGEEPYPWPEPWNPPHESDWYTIFVSEFDCANSPGEEVIENAEDWATWWEQATGCAWIQEPFFMKASSSAGDTLEPWNPGDTTIPGQPDNDPPYVDFDQYLIAAIRIPFDSGDFCMRGAYVTAIGVEEGVTTVYYEVSKLEGNCCDMIMRPFILWAGSPVVAVAFKKPESGGVKFVHSEVTYQCWVPSPDDPLTLHYTDSPCDLGPGEELITDNDAWDAWFRKAIYCDSARWSGGFVGGPEWGDSVIADTVPMPPYNWWHGTPEVDFEHQAVIILRAGEQTRWGGGVWLTNVLENEGSTTIEYCVMDPGADCPSIDVDPGRLNPTVAIRIKKPPTTNIVWHRTIEPILCDWPVDSVLIDPF